MNPVLELERKIFYFINHDLSAPWLDAIMSLLRNALTWIPLYIFILIFFIVKSKKHALAIILLSIACVALTDYTSASVLKPLIGRLRPCYDATLGFTVHNYIGCGGRFSMPSSHAANHFGLATFWYLVVAKLFKKKWYWLFLWAFSIGFAQMYVGVHFPGDIMVGAALGIFIASLVYMIFRKIYERRIANDMDKNNGL